MSATRFSILVLGAALSVATPAAASWPTSPSSPLPAGSGTGAQDGARVVPALDGGCFVVWAESGRVRVRRVTPDGDTAPGWPGSGIVAGQSIAPQSRPDAVADDVGGLFMVWEQGPNASSRDIYAQRMNADGSLFVNWPSTGVAVCLAPGEQSRPRVIRDNSRGMCCAWVDQRGVTGLPVLFGVRLDTFGFVSADWPATGKEIAPVRAPGDPFAMARDGTGGFYTVFIAPDSTARVQRLSGYAQVPAGWIAGSGLALGAGKAAPGALGAAPDLSGGAYLAWNSSEDEGNVRVTRLAPSGATEAGWPAGGDLACGATGAQALGGAIADGLGGVILGWEDHRADGTTHGDVYALRYERDGQRAPGWSADGVAAEASALDASAPALVSDGVGGVLLVYPARVAGPPADLVGMRLTTDGAPAPGWPSAGVPVTSSADDEGTPSLAAAPLGGAYVAWSAGSPSRSWLARLDGSGALGDPPLAGVPAVPATGAPALGFPAPNPSRGGVSLGFTLAAESGVRVSVRDVGGRRIAEPLNARLAAGPQRAWWDGRDRAGHPAPPGLYLLEVEAGGSRAARRVLIAR